MATSARVYSLQMNLCLYVSTCVSRFVGLGQGTLQSKCLIDHCCYCCCSVAKSRVAGGLTVQFTLSVSELWSLWNMCGVFQKLAGSI